jgi:thioredoxin 1
MVPIVTRLAGDFSGRALVGTVDVTTQPALSNAHAIRVVPTFVFFKDGREISRQEGSTSYEDLSGKLQALLGSQ